PATGESIGVTEDGGHQGLTEYTALGVLVVAGIIAPILLNNYLTANPCKSNPGAGGMLNQPVDPCPAWVTGAKGVASLGLIAFFKFKNPILAAVAIAAIINLAVLSRIDPSLPQDLADPILPPPSDDGPNEAFADVQVAAGSPTGA